MAGKTAILSIKIIADGKQAGREFKDTNEQVGKFDDGLRKASVGAGIAVAAIAGVAVAAGNAASDLQQSTGAVESVFGQYADGIKANAEAAAQAVGLSKNSYNELASVLGAQLKNMGMPMDEVATQTEDLVGLGADLAATFGGSTADAVGALSSLLRGERDPIEKYGVSIKQADIAAKMAAMGLDGLEGEAAKAAETQAMLALLTEQTADAQGQFSRESDTAAGAQQRANAEWENAMAALGEGLLPVMAYFAGLLADVAQWVGENTELVITIAAVIGTMAAAILLVNGAITAYRTIATIATAAQIAWNVAMSANPLGLIILAIAAVVAAIVFLITNWEQVKEVAVAVWETIVDWVMKAVEWLHLDDIINGIVKAFTWLKDVAADVWDSIIGGIEAVIGWVQDAIGWFTSLFGAADDADKKGQSAASRGSGGWTPLDDVLFRLYATGATAPAGDTGTGAWPAWTATPGSPAERDLATMILNITMNGILDGEDGARKLIELLRDYAAQTGQRIVLGGGSRWQS